MDQVPTVIPEVSHLGWGHWYTLRELEDSTNGFADENVIGEGGYGIVYHGVLKDNTHVAIKNLLNNKYVGLFFFFILNFKFLAMFDYYIILCALKWFLLVYVCNVMNYVND